MVVYTLPKKETVIGPTRVEGRIETELSEKLTLWNQQGTTVIRGNLLVIPLANTLFYVEPIYLKPENIDRPSLTVVAVQAGAEFAYADTFDEALQKIFGIGIRVESEAGTTDEATAELLLTLDQLIEQANQNLELYLGLTGRGEFEKAAQALIDLKHNLKALESGQYRKKAEKT